MWKRFSQRLLIVASLCFGMEAWAEPVSPSNRVRAAFARVMGEEILSANAIGVCQRAESLDDESRYRYLADWVFPSATHQTLRLKGDLLANDAAPDTVVAPVFDLLEVARKLDRLPELRARLAETTSGLSNEQQRARRAMQLMLAISDVGDRSTLDRDVTELLKLIEAVAPTDVQDVWPETLVATYGMRQPSPEDCVGEILQQIKGRRSNVGLPHHAYEWHGLIFSLTQQFAYHQSHRPIEKYPQADSQLHQWSPAFRLRGYSQGSGFSQARWKFDGTQVEHVSGNDEDYLLYQSPLLGDMALDFDCPSDSQSQFYAGGNLFGPQMTTHMYVGTLRGGAQQEVLAPPLNHLEPWVHCRIEFQGRTRLSYINGRCVRTDTLDEQRFPWVGHHSWGRNQGRLRDVRITGKPTIPESIPLIVDEKLEGWHSYHEVDVGSPNAVWRYEKSSNPEEPGQLVGVHLPWLAGTFGERLLQYQRPMLEDGAIEYEFLYEPNQHVVFPALDRLAFLIDPQKVALHHITDDAFDRSEARPDLLVVEPASQLQPPPLRAGEWNRVRVEIAGQTMTLILNGQPILRRELEATNSRQFGFFYFIEQSSVHVRNVVMSGHWPRTLPLLTEQELAHSVVTELDMQTAKLEPVYHHQFSNGLPGKFFQVPVGNVGGQFGPTKFGLEFTQQSNGPVTKSLISPLLQVRGDFDVRVGFDEWNTTNHDFCGTALEMVAASGHRLAITRRVQGQVMHWAVLEWSIPKGNGEFNSHYQTLATEATGGQLRIVRQGDVWHALFADHDSSVFRIVATVTMEGTASQPVTFNLAAVAGASGRTQFNWKDLRVAASELLLLPDASQAPKVSIFKMNRDGSDLKRISTPAANDPGNGSPDWSADGKRILYDSWRGNATSSRIFLVNADGSNTIEVGAGAMPTFSPDGKRMAFSGAEGMSIMNTDGTQREVVTSDGWGAQWSPDGRWISYGTYRSGNGDGANIAIIDLKTKQTRLLLEGEQAKRYSQIYWNMEWSPDSRKICFKGGLMSGGVELAITAVAGSAQEFRSIAAPQNVEPDTSWHPEGQSILVSMPSPEHAGMMRLFVYDLKTDKFSYLIGQPPYPSNNTGVWSPDGKQIAFVSLPPVEPIPWKQAMEKSSDD